MAKLTLLGHPLHPQLIVYPAGLLPFSLIMDVMHLVTGKKAYAEAAYYTMVGGSVGATAAAGAGIADYLTIQPRTRTKRTANMHGSLNALLLTLYGANLLLRRGRTTPTGALPVLLSAIGSVGLIISAWYGGDMVYEQGMRVRGADPSALTPEVKPPGDAAAARAFVKLEQAVPEGGPGVS